MKPQGSPGRRGGAQRQQQSKHFSSNQIISHEIDYEAMHEIDYEAMCEVAWPYCVHLRGNLKFRPIVGVGVG